MGFDVYRIPVTTTGTAGAATGSGRLALLRPGILRALYINYTSQPATTDVTVAQTIDGNTSVLQQASDTGTDALYFPYDNPETGFFLFFPVFGEITVTVAQGDAAANGVVVVLHVES